MSRFEVTVPGATLVGDDHAIGDHWSPSVDKDSMLLPMVLLHAGVADRRSWERVVPTWSTTRRVITYDQRGFGETTHVEHFHDPVADVLAVLDDRGVERAILVGNSMGGALAVQLAVDHPERVSGLLLIGPGVSGAPWPDDVDQEILAMDEASDAARDRGDLVEALRLDEQLWLDGPRAGQRVDPTTRELFRDMDRRSLAAGPTGPQPDHEAAWPRLSNLEVPVQVILGEHDLPYVNTCGELLASVAPHGASRVIEGVAHLPQLEAHQRTLAACQPFLSSQP